MGAGSNGIEVIDFTPFENPEIRSSDFARPLDHGYLPGVDYYGSRNTILNLEIWGGWASVQKVLTAFQTQSAEIPLVFQLPVVGKLQVNARVRRRTGTIINQNYNLGAETKVVVDLHSTDPRVYGWILQTQTAVLTATTAGMTFGVTPPIVFGAGSSSSVIVTNNGSFETRPVITITGGVTNPYIANDTTGKSLAFNTVLAAGDTLSLDFLNRTVTFNGTSSRYSWVVDSSQWWTLLPGGNSIRLGGTAGSPTPTAVVTWRDAYL